MANSVYLTATEEKSGKSALVLALINFLLSKINKVAIFRPIIYGTDKAQPDADIKLMLDYFKIDISYEESYGLTIQQAKKLINSGKSDVMIDTILYKYKNLEKKCDFIVCEGTDFLGKDAIFEFDLNAQIASSLGIPLIMVVTGANQNFSQIVSSVQNSYDQSLAKSLSVIAYIINMASLTDEQLVFLRKQLARNSEHNLNTMPLIYSVPNDPSIGRPTMDDVKRWLNAEVLYGHGRLDNQVDDYLIAAMHVGNFLNYIEEGNLVVTPSDRTDILLTALSSRLSTSYPNISGILLTGGFEIGKSIHRLIDGWTGVPLPILTVPHHTFKTMQMLVELHGSIRPEDEKKINLALGLFKKHINELELWQILETKVASNMTPQMFQYRLFEEAQREMVNIVLPEGEDERILKACEIIIQRDLAHPIVLGSREKICALINNLGLQLDDLEIIDPNISLDLEQFSQQFFELRKHKGISLDNAKDRMTDPTGFGTMMVYLDKAQGMVSGAVNTTAHTLKPALEFIKTKQGFSIVSSVFFMCLKDRVLVFADCAVNPDPTASELAEIAINAAETATIFGIEPKVAMLSYATGGSGKGADVNKVIEATRIAQERRPDLLIEGPLQFDSAFDPEVAAQKLPNSKIAGNASVFIFPDLNTGNNTYKAVQRTAGAIALGPIIQGLNKPVNDLSRGCNVSDIVTTVAITAVQALALKHKNNEE